MLNVHCGYTRKCVRFGNLSYCSFILMCALVIGPTNVCIILSDNASDQPSTLTHRTKNQKHNCLLTKAQKKERKKKNHFCIHDQVNTKEMKQI